MIIRTGLRSTSTLPMCAAVMLSWCFTVDAQALIQRIGWRAANVQVVVALLLLALCTVVALTWLQARRRSLRDQALLNQSDELFNNLTKQRDLTEIEVQKLRGILNHQPVQHPHIIFQSFVIYEQCVDVEVRRIVDSIPPPDIRETEEVILGNLRKKLGYTYLPLEHPLVSTRNIALGQSGSIFGDNHRTPLIHRARVVANHEFSLSLQYDPEREDARALQPGGTIKFAFARQNDGVYGIVFDILKLDSAGIIECGHTLEFKRNQLRQYVRIEANLPLRVRVLKSNNPSVPANSKVRDILECRTVDISGGGLSFVSERSLFVGDVVSLAFALPSASFAGVPGKIIRISLQEGRTNSFFRHHVQFLTIEAPRREQIVRYVFERQRQANQWR